MVPLRPSAQQHDWVTLCFERFEQPRQGLISAASFVRRHSAVEFLRQTTDNFLGRDHLAVDHLKQLHRVDAQLSAQPKDVGAPGRAQIGDMLAELINFRLWHFE